MFAIQGGKADCTVMQKNAGGAEKHTTVHVSEPDITSQMQSGVGNSPQRKRIQANSTRDGGDGMLFLSSSTRAQEAKQVSQCTIHAQRRTRLKLFFFFFLKKGCTSAPCSMWRLKLTLQALQLQPLATHRNVASGYRQEVAQSPSLPQPHH